MSDQHEITQLLLRVNQGEASAQAKLYELLYPELRRIASARLRLERRGHTYQTTDLVHEAYLRLVDQSKVSWQDRRHFCCMVSRVMRQILTDHARRRLAQKRGKGQHQVPLSPPCTGREEITRARKSCIAGRCKYITSSMAQGIRTS